MNNHIIAMTSGDAAFQADAIQHLFTEIKDSRGNAERVVSSIPVRDVAALYIKFCNEQRRVATNGLLAPYGLDTASYIDKQRSLSDQFVTWVTAEVEDIRNRIGDPILFCGIDETGAHIFHCDGNSLSSCDPFAFAAIGSGGEHAESQFMLAGHTRLTSIGETILVTYVAKKRSEVAPGVGEQTDMFVLSATPLGHYYISAKQLDKLNSVYRKMDAAQERALLRAKREVEKYVKEETDAPIPPPSDSAAQ